MLGSYFPCPMREGEGMGWERNGGSQTVADADAVCNPRVDVVWRLN